MKGKYTINAVDRGAVAWDVCMTDQCDSSLDIVEALRQRFPHRICWITLTDDPERGDVEADVCDEIAERRSGGSGTSLKK